MISHGLLRASAEQKSIIDAETSLLISSNTFDGDTVFTDRSTYGTLISKGGTPTHSTLRSVPGFGSSSIQFLTDVDYLTVSYVDRFNFGAGDFTVDFWYSPGTNGTNHYIYNLYQGAYKGFYIYRGIDQKVVFNMGVSGTLPWGVALVSTSTIAAGGPWYHIAIVRQGSSVRMFINGVKEAEATSITLDLSAILGNPVIGVSAWDLTSNPARGYMQEIRVSKGIARWWDDFTPPVKSY